MHNNCFHFIQILCIFLSVSLSLFLCISLYLRAYLSRSRFLLVRKLPAPRMPHRLPIASVHYACQSLGGRWHNSARPRPFAAKRRQPIMFSAASGLRFRGVKWELIRRFRGCRMDILSQLSTWAVAGLGKLRGRFLKRSYRIFCTHRALGPVSFYRC